MSEFFLPKIEIRSSVHKGVRKYTVKGYATTTDYIYPYAKQSKDDNGKNPIRTFKEYFTEQAIENIKRKAQSEKIWVDYGHATAFGATISSSLNDLEVRSGLNLSEEKEYVKDAFKVGDIPMFKLSDLQIDDKGLFVEIEGNPFYRSVDEKHEKYFDSVWGSLENGFINGMSLNMKATDVIQINDELTQINDVDVYGISLLSGASNDTANITEVAIRCSKNVRGERKCQKKKQILRRMML